MEFALVVLLVAPAPITPTPAQLQSLEVAQVLCDAAFKFEDAFGAEQSTTATIKFEGTTTVNCRRDTRHVVHDRPSRPIQDEARD